jgi:hypothetical protein
MSLKRRIGLAFTLGLFIGINIAMSNGANLQTAITEGLIFSLIISAVVALISWGLKLTTEKGYPVWVGFVLVLFLNIIGILILLLLPNRSIKELNQK